MDQMTTTQNITDGHLVIRIQNPVLHGRLL